MDRDEGDFEKKPGKFSLVKQCPKCGQLALTFQNKKIVCTDCGFEQQVPTLR